MCSYRDSRRDGRRGSVESMVSRALGIAYSTACFAKFCNLSWKFYKLRVLSGYVAAAAAAAAAA